MAAGIHFDITGDNSNFLRKLREVENGVRSTSKDIEQSGMSIEAMFGRMTKAAAAFGGAFTAKEFVRQIVQIRGQFQQLEVAFKTMLGSEEKATDLMSQLVRTAATTPFDLQGVTQGAKQLLAYGTAADDVNDTLVRLGDIAAGLSIPLGDLVYLYGTTMTQGRMFTQDLRQFMGRGVPIAEELAKQFGVAKDEVGELVTAGKVGSEEFQKAIWSMTNEGSKFGGLMEAQSKTITGQISNIEDAIDQMFNRIGQSSEGVINTVLEGVSSLVENYETVGKVLSSLAVTYGVYKATLITNIALTKSWAVAARADSVAKGLQIVATKSLTLAQASLNTVMKANPYVLLATAVVGVVSAITILEDKTRLLREEEERYFEQKQKIIDAENEEKRVVEELSSVVSNESLAIELRRDAMNELEKKYPSIFEKYDTEVEKLKNIKEILEAIAGLQAKTSLSNPVNELAQVDERIKELQSKTRLVTSGKYVGGEYRTTQKEISTRTNKEETELQNLLNRRKELNEQIRKDNVNSYFENLSDVDNATIEEQIKQREAILAKIKLAGEKEEKSRKGVVKTGDKRLTGEFTEQELQYQLNKLKSERNKRNQPKGTSNDWANQAKEAYEDALNAYNEFTKNSINKLTKEDYENKLKELKDNLDTAKKAYDKTKPLEDSKPVTSESRLKAEQDAAEALEKLRNENADNEVNAEADKGEAMRKQIEANYQKRLDEIDKQERKFKELNEKAGLGKDYLTTDQRTELTTARTLASNVKNKEENDIYNDELSAMRNYLKEYGTLQERKLAIKEDYEQKIADSTSVGERLSLQAEMDKALRDVDFAALRDNMDWEMLFGDLSNMTADQLNKVKDNLRTLLSDGTLTVDQYKEIVEQISRVNEALVDEEDTWGRLTEHQRKRKILENEVADAAQREAEALAEVSRLTGEILTKRKQLSDELGKVGISVDPGKLSSGQAQNIMGQVGKKYGADSDIFKKLSAMFGDLASSERDLTNANNKHKVAVDKLTNAENEAEKVCKNWKEVLNGCLETLSKWNANIQELGNLASELGISEDSDAGKVIGNVMGASQKGLNAMTDLVNLNFIGAAANAIGAVKDLGRAFGIGGGNAEEVAKEINRLQKSIDDATASLDIWKDKLDKSYGTKAVAASEEAVKLQQQINDDRLAQAKARAGYSDAHHSFNYYWDGFSEEQIARLNGQIADERKKSGKGAWTGDLWDLSPEEMQQLLANSDMRFAIWDAPKGGYGQAMIEHLEAYAAEAGKIEEITNQLNEKITGLSFDSFFNSFFDGIDDMTKKTEDFADDFVKTMADAAVEAQIGDLMRDDLEQFWNDWANAAKDGLTQAETEEYTNRYKQYIEQRNNIRDDTYAMMGYDPEEDDSTVEGQQRSSNGVASISDNTAKALEGRATAIQISNAEQTAQLTQQTARLDITVAELRNIASIQTSGNVTLNNILTQHVMTNSYLEDVVRYTKSMQGFGVKLDTMIEIFNKRL